MGILGTQADRYIAVVPKKWDDSQGVLGGKESTRNSDEKTIFFTPSNASAVSENEPLFRCDRTLKANLSVNRYLQV